MRTRQLGVGGPEVTVVGLGTNNFGGRCDLHATRAVIDAALEEGITLFDTADIYSNGLSESYIGEVLEGRRDQVVLATKFGKPMEGAPDLPRGSGEYIRWAVEGSLKRLRTDAIDVYQMHEPDESTPFEETLGALNELVGEGKVRWIGSSNYDVAQLAEAELVARERGFARYVSAQNHYSLLDRAVEDELAARVRAARDRAAAVLPAREWPADRQVPPRRGGDEGRLAGREIADERFDRHRRAAGVRGGARRVAARRRDRRPGRAARRRSVIAGAT